MGFFRKKASKRPAGITLSVPLDRVVATSQPIEPSVDAFTAAEAVELSGRDISQYGDDARRFLLLSNSVRRDGRASEWEVHVLYPKLEAEGIWRVTGESGGVPAMLHGRLAPTLEPGTTEYLLAQVSPQIALDQKAGWDDRVSMIAPLPMNLVDSPLVVAAMEQLYPELFLTGPIRLKGRRLPTGEAVWEHKGVEMMHVTFSPPTNGQAIRATVVPRASYYY